MRAILNSLFLTFSLGAVAQVQPPAKAPAPVGRSSASPQATAGKHKGTTEMGRAELPPWWDKAAFVGEKGLPEIHEKRQLSNGTSGFTAYLVDATYVPAPTVGPGSPPSGYTAGPEPVLHTLFGISRKRPVAVELSAKIVRPATS